jgi:hypothetical protein
MKQILYFLVLLLLTTTQHLPKLVLARQMNASSALDNLYHKGLLIPRMTAADQLMLPILLSMA